MTQQEKKHNNPVFYLGIILLVFEIAIIIYVFLNPNTLERVAELEAWKDVGKKIGVPAKIVGLAFGISLIISIAALATIITDYGLKATRVL